MVIVLEFYGSDVKLVESIDSTDRETVEMELANIDNRDSYFCLESKIHEDEEYEFYNYEDLREYLEDNDIEDEDEYLEDKSNWDDITDNIEAIGVFYVTESYYEG